MSLIAHHSADRLQYVLLLLLLRLIPALCEDWYDTDNFPLIILE